MEKRISKDQYYMNIAREVAARSTCFWARYGAIILKDDQIISTGYIGAPRKTKDCFERGNCLRREMNIPSGQRYEMCRSVHSEQNALINAARAGVSLLGAKLYLYCERQNEKGEFVKIDALPCFICKKMIVNSGITEFVSQRTDGTIKTYSIDEWTKNWQTHDLIDDMEQYGVKIIKEKVE